MNAKLLQSTCWMLTRLTVRFPLTAAEQGQVKQLRTWPEKYRKPPSSGRAQRNAHASHHGACASKTAVWSGTLCPTFFFPFLICIHREKSLTFVSSFFKESMRYLQIIREEQLTFTTVIFDTLLHLPLKWFTPYFKLTQNKCNVEKSQSKNEYWNEAINAGEIEIQTESGTFTCTSSFSSLLYNINNMGSVAAPLEKKHTKIFWHIQYAVEQD